MRLHPLAPEVRCLGCGAGLTFIRVRKFCDLYQCACKRQVMHYRNKETKACGYVSVSNYGVFGAGTACGVPAAKKG
jgi:hypothetical protein